MEVIISGYGKHPKNSVSSFNILTGKFISENWRLSLDSPSFICTDNNYIYAGTEANYGAFHIVKNGIALDSIDFNGDALCHIAFSPKNNTLFGACYNSGNIVSAKVNNGKFEGIIQNINQGGRAHSVLLNKDENILYSANIQQDIIYIYNINNGFLTEKSRLKLDEGKGVRHMVLSQSESLLYVITEYSNEILVVDLTERRVCQSVSTLIKNTSERSNCSTLCFSKDKTRILAANRFTDTISVFRVKADGMIEMTDNFSCGGKTPRHIDITSDGTSVIVCNQDSNTIELIDINSGKVTDSKDFFAPSGIAEIIRG